MTFVPLSQFITEDLVAVWAKVPTASGEQEAVLASAYFPGDSSDAPPREVSALEEYCQDKRIRWIIGCDANAHHTVWGSTDVNKRETPGETSISAHHQEPKSGTQMAPNLKMETQELGYGSHASVGQ
ncbi:hypothetical protein ACLKA6_002667 [Drosophila palustris]